MKAQGTVESVLHVAMTGTLSLYRGSSLYRLQLRLRGRIPFDITLLVIKKFVILWFHCTCNGNRTIHFTLNREKKQRTDQKVFHQTKFEVFPLLVLSLHVYNISAEFYNGLRHSTVLPRSLSSWIYMLWFAHAFYITSIYLTPKGDWLLI